MRIAVTGGSGSLGRALVRRLVALGEKVVTFTRDEAKRASLQAEFPDVKVYAGDIRDQERLVDIFAGCDVVIHAAARKVVSGHADEPREMLLTNVLGTQNVILACKMAHVKMLMFISSDKAVHPENVYGVSKAMAEHLVISENARSYPKGLAMSVIRYGNVLGSRGSVVQVWRERKAAGLPLRISDARMTRFWLTIDRAVIYVLTAVDAMRGGEVFVPILSAAPLTRLLEAVAPDAKIEDMGIRPGGEKLHEELLSADEMRRVHNDTQGFFVVMPQVLPGEEWDSKPWPQPMVTWEGWQYRSDTWDRQCTAEHLKEMLR